MKERSNRDLCALILSPRSLIGALIQRAEQFDHYRLQSFYYFPFEHLELEKLTLFNPTIIGKTIAQWLSRHKTTPIAFALHGPSIEEHLVGTHNAHPSIEQFPIQHAPNWQWEFTYLFSRNHKHYFYICGIKKHLLFQYQLMAITHHIPVSLITTERMALAHCYKHLFGSAYRPTHLAEAMELNHDRFEHLFIRDDFSRLLKIPPHIQIREEHYLPLLAACGLHAMQG